MNEVRRAGSPMVWNPKSKKHLYFYSESLKMNFPVSRLDWSGWYRALRAGSPHVDNEDLLAALLTNAAMETRFPKDHWFDTPWYERENYSAGSVMTAGWVPPVRRPTGHVPDKQPVAEELQSQSRPTAVKGLKDPDESGRWYADVSKTNPRLHDLHLLGELIHAISYAAHKAGMPEPKQDRDLVQAIISAGWTPPAAEPQNREWTNHSREGGAPTQPTSWRLPTVSH